MKIAVVTPAIQDPERLFGAERHFVGMVRAFQERLPTDWIQIPVDESRWEGVLQSYLDCLERDLSAYDAIVSTKTPTFMVRHPHHVCWLLHQIRVFYDRFDDEYGKLPERELAEKRQQRQIIHEMDNAGFSRVRKVFTNGHETARRLKHYNGFNAEVLYPPVFTQGHYCAGQDFFFLPGRLHRWKRVDLAIRAMQHYTGDVPLLIAGTGEDERYFRELAGDDPRIQFVGFVSDEEMLALYANALAVLFVPKDEDFGYITVEAMLSHKPVIVCSDSGEPARLVENGYSGFVVQPDAEQIAAAMSRLAADRELARQMGEAAYRSTPSQSWDAVVERLLEGAFAESRPAKPRLESGGDLQPLEPVYTGSARVLVTDNQVLEPAVGGARVRVKELCKGLAAHFATEYIGAFDWPGPHSTDDWPLPSWHSRVFALSRWQYRLAARLQKHVRGGSVIDVAFPWMTRLSANFVQALRASAQSAEVVIFTHPWAYPLCRELLQDKIVIYDAHNFEWGLRSTLLSSTFVGRRLANSVREVEGELVRRCEQVWACSREDADAMSRAYGVPRNKFFLVANCADTRRLRPASTEDREEAKDAKGWAGKSVVLFIGTGYRPNTEAAAFIIEQLAPKFPDVVFAIVGSVKDDYLRTHAGANAQLPANVALLGVIPEDDLYRVLHASDIALNPVEMGSGTNLKLLQYMAAGLPILSTEAGIRGIERGREVCIVESLSGFESALLNMLQNPESLIDLREAARAEAERNYDWQVVTERAVGQLNWFLGDRAPQDQPFFSVVIPTYNRPDRLQKALTALTKQRLRDFEVVVVDQSDPPVQIADDLHKQLRIKYVHSVERGPALARNKGWRAASGSVVAFTDDDCIPEPDWLKNAARYFRERPIAGLEGLIRSDHIGDPRYRTVFNVGVEGVAFMTANMFYRREVLEHVGGFDERFRFAFREDTDLAWRVLKLGEIPYSDDAAVYHPPHPVDVERESRTERAKLFSVDPMLFASDPERYIHLVFREKHYRNTPGFWQHFARGIEEHQLDVPVQDLFARLRQWDPAWWDSLAQPDASKGADPLDMAALQSLIASHQVKGG